MTGWAHTICTHCWVEREGYIKQPNGGLAVRTPVRVTSEEWEPYRCCCCVRWTDAGIVIRENPKATACKGKHDDG